MPMHFDLTEEESKYLLRSLIFSYADNSDDFDNVDISKDNPIKDRLLGKLMWIHPDNRDYYDEIRKERRSNNEPLNKKLFMGAGYQSVAQKNRLHKRLDFAASELSGLQQNGGQGTPFDHDMDRECWDNIISVVKDIIHAFDIPKEKLAQCLP